MGDQCTADNKVGVTGSYLRVPERSLASAFCTSCRWESEDNNLICNNLGELLNGLLLLYKV